MLRRPPPPRTTLHLVAHPVDLLDVRKDHLGVDPVVPDHGVHVVGSEEVRDAGVPPVGFAIEMISFTDFLITSAAVELPSAR